MGRKVAKVRRKVKERCCFPGYVPAPGGRHPRMRSLDFPHPAVNPGPDPLPKPRIPFVYQFAALASGVA